MEEIIGTDSQSIISLTSVSHDCFGYGGCPLAPEQVESFAQRQSMTNHFTRTLSSERSLRNNPAHKHRIKRRTS